MSEQSQNPDNFSLAEAISIFSMRKKIILIGGLIAGLIMGFIAFFVMDLIFLSSGTIKTTSKQSGLSSLIGGADMIPDLGDISSFGGGSVVKELALYENILNSRRCVEATIIRFNIKDENDIKTMFDAVKYFKENVMVVTKDKVAGTMEIGAYDKSPERAKEIANFLIEQLNSINTDLNIQSARNNKEFIQARYDEARKILTNVEDSLKNYQNQFGISPDLQVQAAVKAEIEIEAELKTEEVKLELLRKILSPDQAEVVLQEKKINELRKQLTEIQTGDDETGVLSLKGKPEIVLNYLRIKREVEIQNKIVTTLIPMLEQSKIEEKRETPSVLIIDPPNVPDRKVKPKRLTLTVAAFFVVSFLIFLFFVFKERWKMIKSQLTPINNT